MHIGGYNSIYNEFSRKPGKRILWLKIQKYARKKIKNWINEKQFKENKNNNIRIYWSNKIAT